MLGLMNSGLRVIEGIEEVKEYETSVVNGRKLGKACLVEF